MNYKQILVIFIAVCVFLLPLFFIPELIGGDTYFFVNYIFGITNSLPNHPYLAVLIMNLIPPNFFIIKLIMVLVTFVTCLAIARCGELFDEKYGWLAGLFMLGTLFFTTIFINFENDMFGFMYIACSLYCLLLYTQEKKEYQLYLSIILICIGGLVWEFAIYFLLIWVIISKFNWKLTALFIVVMSNFFMKFITGILPNSLIQENVFGFGLMSLVFFITCYMKDTRFKLLYPAILVSTVLALVNLKFIYVVIPLLVISLAVTITKLPTEAVIFVVLSLLVVFVVVSLTILNAYPNQDINELFSKAQSLQENSYPDKEIRPVWDFGYYWIYWTKKPYELFGSTKPTPKTGIVITREFEKLDCVKYFENKSGIIYIC